LDKLKLSLKKLWVKSVKFIEVAQNGIE